MTTRVVADRRPQHAPSGSARRAAQARIVMSLGISADKLKQSFSKIEELAAANKALADQIREGIRAFERRLQTLDGRVAARINHGEGDAVEFTLGFQQHGSEWKLIFVDRKATNQKPAGVMLADASVETQIRAVAALPGLLDAMVSAHETRMGELEPALDTISKLGIDTVGLYAD
jgi:hypothetical protein